MGCHGNRGQNGWAESCWTGLFNLVQASLKRILGLPDRLCEPLSTLSLAVRIQVIEIIQLVTCDELCLLCAVTNDSDLVVECHDANFTLLRAIRHIVDLRVYGGFDALDTRDISLITIGSVEELVGTIAKLAHLVGELSEVVTSQVVSALDSLGHAHRARYIHAEDDRDVLTGHVSVLHLCCSLKQVSNFSGLRDFLLINHDFVLEVAKLTRPQLAASLVNPNHARLVEDALAAGAQKWIARGQLSLVLQALEVDLGHIRVKLLPELAHLFLWLSLAHDLLTLFERVTSIAAVVAQV